MEIDLIPPWRAVSDGEAAELRRRLKVEVSERHGLYERGATVIGRSDAGDDILIALSGGDFAIVHLLWGEPPADGRWPSFEIFASAEAVREALRVY